MCIHDWGLTSVLTGGKGEKEKGGRKKKRGEKIKRKKEERRGGEKWVRRKSGKSKGREGRRGKGKEGKVWEGRRRRDRKREVQVFWSLKTGSVLGALQYFPRLPTCVLVHCACVLSRFVFLELIILTILTI